MPIKEIKQAALDVYKPNLSKFIVGQVVAGLAGVILMFVAAFVALFICAIFLPDISSLSSFTITGDVGRLLDALLSVKGIIGIVIAAIVYGVIASLSIPLSTGLYRMASKGLKGEEFSAGTVFECFKINPANVIVTSILSTLLAYAIIMAGIIVYAIIVGILVVAVGGIVAGLIAIILSIAYVVFVVLVYLRFVFIQPILAEDPNKTAGAVISESMTLGANNTGKIIAFILSFIGWYILFAIITVIVSKLIGSTAQQIVTFIIGLFFTPYITCAIQKLYQSLK